MVHDLASTNFIMREALLALDVGIKGPYFYASPYETGRSLLSPMNNVGTVRPRLTLLRLALFRFNAFL